MGEGLWKRGLGWGERERKIGGGREERKQTKLRTEERGERGGWLGVHRGIGYLCVGGVADTWGGTGYLNGPLNWLVCWLVRDTKNLTGMRASPDCPYR